MGTFLGNLQVLNAAEKAVSALLPRAVVGQWSERFVTVLDEAYGIGTVARPARLLSGKLPEAVVLSAALADSDLLELAVWQGGKRITLRAHVPYGGVSKRGDPKKFCRMLGLPPEDEKRLKAVWAKGNAEEQLELTAALLGAPLGYRADHPPEGRVVRNAARVDDWLARHPDPPKVKNQTRAEEIQCLVGYAAASAAGGYQEALRAVLCSRPHAGGGCCPEEDVVLRPGPSGCLEEWEECRDIVRFRPELRQSGDRVFAWWLHLENGWGGAEGSRSMLLADSWNALTCPFCFPLDGRDRECQVFWSVEDGGLLAWINSVGVLEADWRITAPEELVRYAPDGSVRWRRTLNKGERSSRPAMLGRDVVWLNGDAEWVGVALADGRTCARVPRAPGMELLDCPSQSGELWAVKNWFDRETMQTEYQLVRMDWKGNVLQSGDLPARLSNGVDGLMFLRDGVLFYAYDEGLWLLDRDTLSVRRGTADHRSYVDASLDGMGRVWVQVGGSTVEAYDQDGNLLSRHRLKGSILGRYLDDQGRLCAAAYSESKGKEDVRFDGAGEIYFPKFDPKKEIVRVYRLA